MPTNAQAVVTLNESGVSKPSTANLFLDTETLGSTKSDTSTHYPAFVGEPAFTAQTRSIQDIAAGPIQTLQPTLPTTAIESFTQPDLSMRETVRLIESVLEDTFSPAQSSGELPSQYSPSTVVIANQQAPTVSPIAAQTELPSVPAVQQNTPEVRSVAENISARTLLNRSQSLFLSPVDEQVDVAADASGPRKASGNDTLFNSSGNASSNNASPVTENGIEKPDLAHTGLISLDFGLKTPTQREIVQRIDGPARLRITPPPISETKNTFSHTPESAIFPDSVQEEKPDSKRSEQSKQPLSGTTFVQGDHVSLLGSKLGASGESFSAVFRQNNHTILSTQGILSSSSEAPIGVMNLPAGTYDVQLTSKSASPNPITVEVKPSFSQKNLLQSDGTLAIGDNKSQLNTEAPQTHLKNSRATRGLFVNDASTASTATIKSGESFVRERERLLADATDAGLTHHQVNSLGDIIDSELSRITNTNIDFSKNVQSEFYDGNTELSKTQDMEQIRTAFEPAVRKRSLFTNLREALTQHMAYRTGAKEQKVAIEETQQGNRQRVDETASLNIDRSNFSNVAGNFSNVVSEDNNGHTQELKSANSALFSDEHFSGTPLRTPELLMPEAQSFESADEASATETLNNNSEGHTTISQGMFSESSTAPTSTTSGKMRASGREFNTGSPKTNSLRQKTSGLFTSNKQGDEQKNGKDDKPRPAYPITTNGALNTDAPLIGAENDLSVDEDSKIYSPVVTKGLAEETVKAASYRASAVDLEKSDPKLVKNSRLASIPVTEQEADRAFLTGVKTSLASVTAPVITPEEYNALKSNSPIGRGVDFEAGGSFPRVTKTTPDIAHNFKPETSRYTRKSGLFNDVLDIFPEAGNIIGADKLIGAEELLLSGSQGQQLQSQQLQSQQLTDASDIFSPLVTTELSALTQDVAPLKNASATKLNTLQSGLQGNSGAFNQIKSNLFTGSTGHSYEFNLKLEPDSNLKENVGAGSNARTGSNIGADVDMLSSPTNGQKGAANSAAGAGSTGERGSVDEHKEFGFHKTDIYPSPVIQEVSSSAPMPGMPGMRRAEALGALENSSGAKTSQHALTSLRAERSRLESLLSQISTSQKSRVRYAEAKFKHHAITHTSVRPSSKPTIRENSESAVKGSQSRAAVPMSIAEMRTAERRNPDVRAVALPNFEAEVAARARHDAQSRAIEEALLRKQITAELRGEMIRAILNNNGLQEKKFRDLSAKMYDDFLNS